MRKKLLSVFLGVAMVVTLVAGCSSTKTVTKSSEATSKASTETSSKASTEKSSTASTQAVSTTSSGGGTIGIAMPTKSLERWNRDGSYLEEQFKKAGYKVELTYSDNKSDQQVNDIQNLIADKVNLLVVAAIDGDTLSTVLADAKTQNIPVIAYDRLIMNTDAVSYYVSFDNYTVGKLQAQYIIDNLKLDSAGSNKYNMEITAGDPADNNAKFFYNGAMDTLKQYIDKGVLKVPSGQTKFEDVATAQWDTSKAMDRMQNILASYYANGTKLDVCLCSNDSTALGVEQAVSSDYAGKNVPLVTGQDGDEANLKNILDGKQAMTVYKAVANEAVVTLNLAEAMLKGEKPDDKLIQASGWGFECNYDTKSYNNGKADIPSYLLTPDVVTKDNYKAKLVDTGYYTLGSDGYLKAATK